MDDIGGKFWDRVSRCSHKNLSGNYMASLSCSMINQGCSGPIEEHCLDCGVYIAEDPCGEHAGMSGWSDARWKMYWKNRAEKWNGT